MRTLQRAFHGAVDVLSAASARLFELPVTLLLSAALLAFIAAVLLARWLSPRVRALLRGERLVWLVLGYGLLSAVLLFDHKQQRATRELRALERELVSLGTERSRGGTTGDASTSRELSFRNAVRSVLPEASVRVSAEAPGLSYLSAVAAQPRLLVAHVAVIDLEEPGLQIEITEALGRKIPLSQFARAHDCVVAINGEAGTMPTLEAELGEYIGNWVVRGKVVTLSDTAARPFLAVRPRQPRRLLAGAASRHGA